MMSNKRSTPTTKKPANATQRWPVWLVIALVVIIGFIVALMLWLKPTDKSPSFTANESNTTKSASSVAISSSPNASTLQSISPSQSTTAIVLPKSLQNTQVDGEIIIDSNKQLVVTAGLRRLFDYFLSAQGEQSMAQISQNVISYIGTHTPEPAAGQAIAIFNQYLKYLTAASQLDKALAQAKSTNTTLDLTSIKAHLQSVQQLQAQYFDDKTREAFFGDEQALNNYTLQVVEANQNQQLSAQQRQAIIDKAQSTYLASFKDPAVQSQLRQQQNIEKLLQETEQLQKNGATQAQINAMRSKYVSPEAVKRLEQLDQSEAEFAQRVNTYKTQRTQIIAKLGNTPQAQQQITQLQQSLFTPQEQLRLDVLAK